MCFSAQASFVTAGITGAIGVIALTRVNEPRELPLAATPLLLALQQGIEGMLWLNLPLAPDGSMSMALTLLYLFFAEAFWPLYAPIAVWLIEPSEPRRHLMLVCLGVGAGVGAYLLWWILGHPHPATILDYHIVYGSGYRQPGIVGFGYLVATGLPLMLSSQRTVVVLGAIVFAGLVVAYAFYWEAFISVWCFFAAAASVAILCHFEWSRRRSLRTAGA
jgi:hypothetical protein